MSSYADYEFINKKYDLVRLPFGADLELGAIHVELRTVPSEWHLLDLGCGTGNYAKYYLDYGVGKVSLLDGTEGMLQKAKEKLKPYVDAGRVGSLMQGLLPDIPFPDNEFDVVTINCVVHHLDVPTEQPTGFPNVCRTLHEVHRVLKPGGVVTILTVSQDQSVVDWVDSLLPQRVLKMYKSIMPPIPKLESMLYDAGFKSVGWVTPHHERFSHDSVHNDVGRILDRGTREGYNSAWAMVTDEEMTEVEKRVKQMQKDGSLEQHIRKQEKECQRIGVATVMTANRSKIQLNSN